MIKMNLFTAKWPFYIIGPALAILTVGSLYLFNDNIGLSDAMTAASVYCENVADGGKIADAPDFDWQFGLLIGIVIGAFFMAIIGGDFKLEYLCPKKGAFTNSALLTLGGGILGGFLVMLGVQLSGDTLWGHVASAIQLSGGAWLFLISMIVSGVLLAVLWERRSKGGK